MTLVRARWLPGAFVAAVTFLLFLPALGNGFVNWDDDENFLWNPHYRGLGPAQLRWMFTAVHQGLYVPMAWVTLGLDHALWGMDPFGYHLTSVALHAVNAALVYLVARRLLAAALDGEERASAQIGLGAAVAALVFSLHPLRVESVAWVTERRDVVVGLFTLLTVLAYLRACRRGAAGRLHRGWAWTAVGSFGLALLSKPIVVGLPLVLLALDVYPLRRLAGAGASRRARLGRLVVEKLPFLALGAAISALTLAILSQRRLLAGLATVDPLQRLAVAAYGLAFYLGKTLVPWPLSPLYTLEHPIDPWTARYLAPAAVVLALTAVVILAARRWPAGLVVWVSYVLLLLPVLGLFHSGPQITADRYSYLACLGPAVLAGAGVAWCRRAARRRLISPPLGPAALAAAALLLLGLGALTVRQIGIWHDSVTLWQHAAAADPDSDIPIFYLGWALADARRFDEARTHFTRTLPRVPDSLPGLRAQLFLHRAIVAQRAGDATAAEEDLRRVLAIDPEHPVAWIRLGGVVARRGDLQEAGGLLARAASLSPVWPRYQLWEIRAAVEAVPAVLSAAREPLDLALDRLLVRQGGEARR